MKVVGLYRYPVKSLRGHAVGEAFFDLIGMAGDRRWMVVDRSGRFKTIRQIPAMARVDAQPTEHGIVLSEASHGSIEVATPGPENDVRDVKIWDDVVPARQADPTAGAFLTKVLGEEVDLVYFGEPLSRPVDQTIGAPGDYVTFADGFPILVTTTGSLNHLNGLLPTPVGMDRFRPNIVVDTPETWLEDHWRVIRVGAITLRIVKPCARCVITTRDQLTGEQPDPREPLLTLGKYHRARNGGIIFGQNAIPDSAGMVSVGDPVEIVESGPSNLH